VESRRDVKGYELLVIREEEEVMSLLVFRVQFSGRGRGL
jgi:hypothetical protein